MGVFRIYSASLGVDYEPEYYTPDITLNVSETKLEVSEFTGKRDCIVFAQFDKYNFSIRNLSATDYEDVFKVIINQTITFYPDTDLGTNFLAKVVKAKPYYLDNVVWKDALLLELIPADYMMGAV